MTPGVHPECERLIDEMLVMGAAATDNSTAAVHLREHLETCFACRAYLDAGRRSIAALNGFSFPVDPALPDRITAALRQRAGELDRQQPDWRTVAVATAAALILTLAGSFFDMRLSGLLATLFDVQRAQIQQGLLTFWIGPSLCLLVLFPLLPLLGRRTRGAL